MEHWFEDLTTQIQVLPEVGLNQDNRDVAEFVELLLGIGFLSLQTFLNFRIHHQVSEGVPSGFWSDKMVSDVHESVVGLLHSTGAGDVTVYLDKFTFMPDLLRPVTFLDLH